MSLDQLKAVTANAAIHEHTVRLGLDPLIIIGWLQKGGAIAEKVIADLLPLVPPGTAVASILTMIETVLGVLIPTS